VAICILMIQYPESSDKHLGELFGRLKRSEKLFGA
jgi:hypothetical protein